MKGLLGITVAIVLHAAFLLFGGLLFMHDDKKHASVQQVELVSDDINTVKDKAKEKQAEKPKETESEVKADPDKPPDADQIVRDLEKQASPLALAPRLEDVSLSAIEAALSGQAGTGGGDFGDVFTAASGGVVGGQGKAGAIGDQKKADDAFTMAEIDQKPRCTLQTGPVYPAEMRGKKVEGVVTVIFVVDSSGRVTSQKVEKSSHAAFERPALDAVHRWKFEPAVKAGQSVACQMRITIRFDRS